MRYIVINVGNVGTFMFQCLGFSLMKRNAVGISEMLNDLTKYTEDGPR